MGIALLLRDCFWLTQPRPIDRVWDDLFLSENETNYCAYYKAYYKRIIHYLSVSDWMTLYTQQLAMSLAGRTSL